MHIESTAALGESGEPARGLAQQASPDLVALALTSSLLPRGRTVADVRSRASAHAVWWALEAGARVVAFESIGAPDAELTESARLNGVSGLIEVSQWPASGPSGLDGMLAGRDVALIRIDAPAAALVTLRGAAATLDRCKPMVLVEGVDDKTLSGLAGFLEPRGYELHATLGATLGRLWAHAESVEEAAITLVDADRSGPADAEGPAHHRDRDPDRRALTAERAFERVRAEAIQYKNQRDRLAARVSATTAEKHGMKSRHVSRAARFLRRIVRHPREFNSAWRRLLGSARSLGNATSPETQATRSRDLTFVKSAAHKSTHQGVVPTLAAGPLRIAALVDKFSEQGFKQECDFVNLRRDTWREQIEEFGPTVLLVESAWRGAANSWTNAVPKLPEELRALTRWCNDRGIPTVFWNKEDPIHFSTFLRTATQFDYILTTDADLVPAYRAEARHHRVGLMPFASQPADHNPRRDAARKHAAVFAGTYYRRYPERMKDFDAVVDGTSRVLPVEIFDRVYGTTNESFEFPQKYKDMIVGTLTPEELDLAYKRYELALNMNTVKQSTTMVARRAFELLMSGTPTVSNWARGSQTVFGDIVAMSDDSEGTTAQVHRLVHDELFRERIRSLGLRRTLRDHTYAERINLLESMLRGTPYRVRTVAVTAVLVVNSEAELETMTAVALSQEGVDVSVTVVTESEEVARVAREQGVEVWTSASAPLATIGDLVPRDHVAFLHPRHWYGTEYLLSLVIATPYAAGAHLTKHGYFEADAAIRLRRVEWCHTRRRGEAIDIYRSLLTVRDVSAVPLWGVLRDGMVNAADSVGVDPFDFVSAGAGRPEASAYGAHDGVNNTGSAIEDLIASTDNQRDDGQGATLRAVERASLPSAAPAGSGVVVEPVGATMIQLRRDAEGPDVRLSFRGVFRLAEHAGGELLHVRFESVGGLKMRLVIDWCSARGLVLGSDVVEARSQRALHAPAGAVAARPILVAAGYGTAVITFVGMASSLSDVELHALSTHAASQSA